MAELTGLRLAGWMSIRDAEIQLRPLNVLIGGNGAGKSNLVSFFKLVSAMREGRFQAHVATVGGAESLLHFGSKRTQAIAADFRLTTDLGHTKYSIRLVPAAGNTLIFNEEELRFYPQGAPGIDNGAQTTVQLGQGGGHRESELGKFDEDDPVALVVPAVMRITADDLFPRVFHFHDTSALGPLRRDCFIDANRYLYPDGANLPAMLYLYRQRYPTAYRRIVAAVRAIAPAFEDFVLEPLRLNPRNVALHWRARGRDYELGPHQLSDGTLRAIALFTLLLQPEADLPGLIVLDEPELGLHPAALAVLAGMLRSASERGKLLVATQSAALIDQFDVEDVVTVELRDGASAFERLDPEALKEWLAEYTLSELWERNVIGAPGGRAAPCGRSPKRCESWPSWAAISAGRGTAPPASRLSGAA